MAATHYEGHEMSMIGRAGWNARRPKGDPVHVPNRLRKEFIIHHSGGPSTQSIRAIQDWCMDGRGFDDIDYNMMVRQDGRVYVGRGLSVRGAHAKGHNTAGIGVCVVGTDELAPRARTALRYVYRVAVDFVGRPLLVLPHSSADATDCPGDTIRRWIAHGWCNPRRLYYLPGKAPRIGEDVRDVQRIVHVTPDAEFGPKTDHAVRKWQRGHKLNPDGIVGPYTRSAMGL